jgi:small nuclear ribonucleoprotein F
VSVDGYMNLHVANTEEYIDGTNTGALGEVLIRFSHFMNFTNENLKVNNQKKFINS